MNLYPNKTLTQSLQAREAELNSSTSNHSDSAPPFDNVTTMASFDNNNNNNTSKQNSSAKTDVQARSDGIAVSLWMDYGKIIVDSEALYSGVQLAQKYGAALITELNRVGSDLGKRSSTSARITSSTLEKQWSEATAALQREFRELGSYGVKLQQYIRGAGTMEVRNAFKVRPAKRTHEKQSVSTILYRYACNLRILFLHEKRAWKSRKELLSTSPLLLPK